MGKNELLFEYRKSVICTIKPMEEKIMATKKVNLTLEEQIGFSAGEIYNYLHQNGTTTFAKMKKELDLKSNFADLGLGWLARENKVEISQKGPAVKVSLK
jgi:hypothetical protein